MSALAFAPTNRCTPCPCPAWCTAHGPQHREHGVDHLHRVGATIATADPAEQRDDGFLVPGAVVTAYQEDALDEGHVELEVFAGRNRCTTLRLRPAEAAHLAGLLEAAVDVVGGGAR